MLLDAVAAARLRVPVATSARSSWWTACAGSTGRAATPSARPWRRHLPPGSSWVTPEGGLFLWATLPRGARHQRPPAPLPGGQRGLRARPRRLPRRPGRALAAAELLGGRRGRPARGRAPHRRGLRASSSRWCEALAPTASARRRAVKVAVLRGRLVARAERLPALGRRGSRAPCGALGHEPVAARSPTASWPARWPAAASTPCSSRCTAPAARTASSRSCARRLGVPYTGSGPAAAAIAFHKPLAKRLWRRLGLPTPPFFTMTSDACASSGCWTPLPAILDDLGLPLVAKPARGGTALGIRLARDADEVPAALLGRVRLRPRGDARAARRRPRPRRLGGRARRRRCVALPVVEARPREREFYDFEARYTPGPDRVRRAGRPAPEAALTRPSGSRSRPARRSAAAARPGST